MTTPSAFNDYAAAYASDYGFEQHMVWARQRHLCEQINQLNPQSVIEVGCGQSLLIDAVNPEPSVEWHIIEPAQQFADVAMAAKTRYPSLQVHAVPLEQWENTSIKADLVILSSLLHEISDLASFFNALQLHMTAGCNLLVNVPSATSMHRQLACAMGLIKTPDTLSARNASLKQHRVFGMETLQRLLKENGFTINDSGGYFLKPFTHQQMDACLPNLPENILHGLYTLGKQYPEMASEIWICATLT